VQISIKTKVFFGIIAFVIKGLGKRLSLGLILVVKLSQYFNTPEEEPGQHFRKRIPRASRAGCPAFLPVGRAGSFTNKTARKGTPFLAVLGYTIYALLPV